MERLTEKRNGQNVIPLRQDGKTKWVVTCAGMGDKSTQFLYGTHANKLADYEDAEEQGLLLRLPCKVGDTVYFVRCGKIKEGLVKEVVIRLDTILISIYDIDEKFIYQKDFKNLGHTWFTTKKQAKAKLKEMECE